MTSMLFVNFVLAPKAWAADEFDTLREKWKQVLTGGTSYNTNDPDIAAGISRITDSAQSNWDSMDKSSNRTYLWSDLASTTISSHMTSSYTRLKSMALAYSTYGSSLFNNSALLNDIIGGLDWLYENRYNENAAMYDGVWDWKMGVPVAYNDIMVMLYDELESTQQMVDYTNAVGKYANDTDFHSSSTGANRVWRCTVVAVYGVVTKNSSKLNLAKSDLMAVSGKVFDYVTSSDGFYADGSFIQHTAHPYNGGYGVVVLYYASELLYLLSGSAWEVNDPKVQNIYDWIYKGYEPLIYKGMIFDNVMGRNVSAYTTNDHIASHKVIASIIRLSQFAPPADATAFKSMVKHWIQADTYQGFLTDASLEMTAKAKEIMNDSSIIPRGELSIYKQYPSMDRVVQQRPGYAFGVSMYSKRVFNYESINGTNLKGWHTGSGMTYLYNADLAQFSDNFWPTVNPYRLPGTTVLQAISLGQGKRSDQSWVGGTDILDLYGVTGMQYHQYGSNLFAKKSWFMFDDEIVALGADIDSTDNKVVETIVENRKLNSVGNNALTVNGTAKSATLDWTEQMTGVNWAHLAGSVAGSDIGYYFPQSVTINGKRESRTRSWDGIDSRTNIPTTPYTNNYLSLWFDHGSNPTDASYSYALLPNKTSTQVSSYASNPDITILENSSEAQAVKENGLNMIGVNFWNDITKTVDIITSNKKSSIMTIETNDDIEVSVSDPTQENIGTINVEINKRASGVLSSSAGITVTQLSPTIKFAVNVNNAKGKAFKVKFDLSGATAPTLLLDENFNADTTGTAPAGWTSTTGGGTITVAEVPGASDKSMKVDDNSSTYYVTTKKSFAPATGPIIAEFKAKAMQTTGVSGFSLRNSSGINAVTVAFNSNGYIYTYDGGTVVNIQTYTPDTWYEFRIAADPSTGLFDLYLNSGNGYTLVAGQKSFRNAISSLDEVYINTYTPKGVSYYDDIIVY